MWGQQQVVHFLQVENAIKRTRALQHMSALPYHTGIDPALRDQNMAVSSASTSFSLTTDSSSPDLLP